jgi:hypothetical protein
MKMPIIYSYLEFHAEHASHLQNELATMQFPPLAKNLPAH